MKKEQNEYNLPEGWKMVNLGEIFTIERGGSPRPIEDYITTDSDGINWIKIGDTKGITKYIYKTSEKIKPAGSQKSRMVYDGDFILSNSMSFGRPYIMKTSGCIHDGWLVIRKNKLVDNDFLFYVLGSRNTYLQFSKLAKGSTVKNLNIEAVKQVQIPLPPLPTQQSIVSKIEELFSELDKGVEQLKTAQQQLKTYRQSVLKWAFEGKLTNKNVKEGELPEGWKWVKMGELIKNIDAGKSFKCDERPPLKEEVGVLKVSAITWSEYNESESKTVLDNSKINKSYFVKEGDFILSRANTIELVGNSVIAKNISKKLMLSDKTLRIKFEGFVKDYFILYFLRSKKGRAQIEQLSSGNQESMRNIGQEKLKQIQVPLPTVEEQQLIVSEIESRLSVADKLEENIAEALARAESLRQSILKRAFEGRLV